MRKTHKRAAIIGAAVLALAVARPAAGFLNDMAGHWAGPLVGALEAHGIVSGDEDGRFNPEAPLTRAQLAKLLVTGLGYQGDAQLLAKYPSRFTDVPTWHWANGYIESLAESGDVAGYPEGGFGPEDTVTRAQLAVIFVRAAGLGEQARVMRFEKTGYTDDADIPDWARGFVSVARTAGLMAGFEDNSFRPLEPVKRAEGSAAIFRLLSLKGGVFDLSGTITHFDPDTLQGTVRDSTGAEHSFTMSPIARYYRSGALSYAAQIQVLDQVWIVLGPDGKGTFMDARYADLLVTNLKVAGPSVTFTGPDGSQRSLDVQPGALTFLNGRPTSAGSIGRATDGYLILDRLTGEVRVLDALNVAAKGTLVGFDAAKATLVVQVDQTVKLLPVAKDVIFVLNGQRVAPETLLPGDRTQVALNQDGTVTYVLAER